MLEWTKLPRSIRYETSSHAFDVWLVVEFFQARGQSTKAMQKGYRFTVFDKYNHQYIGSGIRLTEDEACEDALKTCNL